MCGKTSFPFLRFLLREDVPLKKRVPLRLRGKPGFYPLLWFPTMGITGFWEHHTWGGNPYPIGVPHRGPFGVLIPLVGILLL